MRLVITFHGPFRVATGLAGRGADVTVDLASPLPGSSLKGVMRDATDRLLRLPEVLIEEVFGSEREPSPWWWSDADFSGSDGASLRVNVRTRIRISQTSHTAETGGLVVAEELWPDTATFNVERRLAVTNDRVSIHDRVLEASAAAVHSLGADRRRGFGWVTIRRSDHGRSPDLAGDIIALREPVQS